MIVVRIVGDRVGTGRVVAREIVLVGVDGVHVALDRIRVAADADVDVRRHVDEVAGAGDDGAWSGARQATANLDVSAAARTRSCSSLRRERSRSSSTRVRRCSSWLIDQAGVADLVVSAVDLPTTR